MGNILLVIALLVFALWGFRLMGKLDRFLHGRFVDEDDDTTGK